MKTLAFLLAGFLFPTQGLAYTLGLTPESPLFGVEEAYIEHRQIEHWRNPYYPGKDDWLSTSEFHMTFHVLERLYLDNNFHISMEPGQIRHGGWEYWLGLRVHPNIHLVKHHHSEHTFDRETKPRFPVEDSYGVRVYFKPKGESHGQ